MVAGTFAILQRIFNWFFSRKKVYVFSPADLPAPSSGVRNLLDEYTYKFLRTVDLMGDRLVAGNNTVIKGESSENCRIKSTGLVGQPLITSIYSMPLQFITIEADVALNLNGSTPTAALDWIGVNFTDCGSVGTIQNYNNFIATDCALINSGGYTFDGTMGTVGFNSCLFDTAPTKTAITISSSATITRRFRVIYSAFVALSGETALNVSTSAAVPIEGYILDTCNFSGAGTYHVGVQYNDNKADFVACKGPGIVNSKSFACYYMNGNTTPTPLALATPTKILGTTTAHPLTQRFVHSNNRMTYIGAIQRDFKFEVVRTMTASNNHQIGTYIAVNGIPITLAEPYVTTNGAGRAECIPLTLPITLNPGDYYEVWTEDNTAPVTNDLTSSMMVIVTNIPR